MKIKIFIVFILFLFLMPMLVGNNYCLAEARDSEDYELTGETPDAARTVTLDNPLGGINTAQDLIGQIVNAILGVVGSLALLMFVYGGLTWMTAAGNEEKIKKGKGILMWATIGLVVIFTSYAVLNFIIGILQGS